MNKDRDLAMLVYGYKNMQYHLKMLTDETDYGVFSQDHLVIECLAMLQALEESGLQDYGVDLKTFQLTDDHRQLLNEEYERIIKEQGGDNHDD